MLNTTHSPVRFPQSGDIGNTIKKIAPKQNRGKQIK